MNAGASVADLTAQLREWMTYDPHGAELYAVQRLRTAGVLYRDNDVALVQFVRNLIEALDAVAAGWNSGASRAGVDEHREQFRVPPEWL